MTMMSMTSFPIEMLDGAKDLAPPPSPLNIDCDLVELVLAAAAEQPTKRVHFGTATTYTFNVAYGGSAVPKEAGPGVGMARYHCDIACIELGTSKICKRGRVRKFDHMQRVELLKKAHYSGRDIADFCMEAIEVRKSRAETAAELRRKRKRVATPCDAPHPKRLTPDAC